MMRRQGMAVAGVLALVCAWTVGASAADPVAATADSTWSLDRCLQAAAQTSPVMAAGRARVEAARAAAAAAAAGRLPSLGLQGQSSYTTETMHLQMPTPTGARDIAFGDGSTTDLMLGVQAPLYRGGALAADLRAATDRRRASEADAAGDSLDLRLQVRQAFYAALGGEAAAGAARQGEARLRRHLAEVEADLADGMATREMRLQVLARLRRTEQATIAAEAAAADTRYRLGRLVGQAGRQVWPAADLDASLLGDGGSGTAPEAVPWDDRPRLRALDARHGAAEEAAHAAAGSLLPAVDLQAGWHYGKPGIDPVANAWMDYGTVALSLRWNLFDFDGRSSRVSSLRAESRALAAARDDVRDATVARQANARTQLEAARQASASAADRHRLEEERLAMAHERWRQGHATESELLDAQDDVTLAATDLAAARARLRLAESELLAASGW